MRTWRREDGFMLTELLVASVMTIVVLTTVAGVFAAFSNQQRRDERQNQAEDTARQVLDRIAVDLRSAASPGAVGNQPVELHSSYDIVYLVPSASASLTNNPRGLVHVRYCLDASNPQNEALWMQTLAYDSVNQPSPPSASSCPSASYSTQQLVATNLVNQAASPATPLFTTPTDPSGYVTDVNLHALVDANTTKDPPATDLQSSVTLRNLNHPPTAALTCQAASNGHALCDASASVDPDGQTLTFSWKMDGGALTNTSYSLDQAGLASRSTHTFMVTVTDSSGVPSSASQSVTMP
jgi:Tfp pilus assembly protein PilW